MFAIMSGPLGSGKTLAAVGLISRYLGQGRKVATNIDIGFGNFKQKKLRCICMRLSDSPTKHDLYAIGKGHDGDHPDEERNGLLILDEAALWLNSRNWSQSGRQDVINWFVHARKRRWDVVIIAQHEDVLDKSVRQMFGEYSIRVMNLNKISVPVVGRFGRLFGNGEPWRLPKIHKATWYYNGSSAKVVYQTDSYTGKDVYHMFDTEQGYSEQEDRGTFSYLSPWHLHGRYETPKRSIPWGLIARACYKWPLYIVAREAERLGWLQRSGLRFYPTQRSQRNTKTSAVSA